MTAWWFDPRTGEARPVGRFPGTGSRVFDPPGLSEELPWLQTGRGCDWVLVLDDAEAGHGPPGRR